MPLRTDSGEPVAQRFAQRPIVLARLPRVGATATVDSQSGAPALASTETLPAAPVFIPQSPPQRTELPVPDESLRVVSDRSHAAPHNADTRPLPPPSRFEAPPQYSRHRTRGSKLYELQGRMAPHAGLIVALALLASAGLLYCLMLGPTVESIDYHNLPGEAFGESAVEPAATQPTSRVGQVILSEQWSAPPHEAQLANDATQPADDEAPPESEVAQPESDAAQPTSDAAAASDTAQPAADAAVEVAPPAEESAPSPAEPPRIEAAPADFAYPTTSYPAPYDFTKLQMPVGPQPAAENTAQPAVAERRGLHIQISEPINR